MTPTSPSWLRSLSDLSWRLLVVAGFLILLGLAAARLRLIFLPVLAAIILATSLLPAKRWLRRRGLSNTLAAVVVVGGAALLLAAVAGGVAATFVEDFQELNFDIEEGLEKLGEGVAATLGVPDETINEAIDDIVEEARGSAGTLAGGLFSGVLVLAEVVAGAVLLVVLLFLIVKDAERMQRAIARRMGRAQRRDFLAISNAIWTTLGRYFRGIVAVAFVDAVLIGIGLAIIGVPFVLPLAVLTFFGAFIPIIGAILAGVAAVLVALAAEGVGAAIGVGVLVLAVQQLEGNLLAPLIVGRAVSLHPAVILVAVAIGATLWGILGAFVAVPVTTVGFTLVDYYTTTRPNARRAPAQGSAAPLKGAQGTMEREVSPSWALRALRSRWRALGRGGR